MCLSIGLRQQGLGLVSAIFLITVVAAIAVGVASLVRTSGESFAQDVLGLKAFLAAESGAQLGLNRLYAPVGAGVCADRVFDLNQPGLERCQANVTCRADTADGQIFYTLRSEGRCVAANSAAERHVLVRALP